MGIWNMCLRITRDELQTVQGVEDPDVARSYLDRLFKTDPAHVWMDKSNFLITAALDAPVAPEKRPVLDLDRSGTPLLNVEATYANAPIRFLAPDEVQAIVEELLQSGWDGVPEPPSADIP